MKNLKGMTEAQIREYRDSLWDNEKSIPRDMLAFAACNAELEDISRRQPRRMPAWFNPESELAKKDLDEILREAE